jgi:glutathione S-transferase
MGTGRYSQFASYESWLAFANAQRVHYNYVEGAASAITFALLSGLYFPRISAYSALAYCLGREIFAAGYMSKGPNHRIYGALILDVALLTMLGAAVTGAVRQTNLLAALK